MKPTITVYSRLYCHLCESLLGQLYGLQQELDFPLEVVDVDSDPALQARYNDWVPVVTAEGEEICHHFLDEAALRRYLAEA